MKKIPLLLALVLPLSCMERMNDLVHEEVPAEFIEFEIENQKTALILKDDRKVQVEMPIDTDLTSLKIKKIKYTEGARLSKPLAEGDILDLSEPFEVELFTYDPYVWTITGYAPLSPGAPVTLNGPDPGVELTREGPQVYNMGFDLWSKYPESDIDVLYASGASAEEQIWSAYGFWLAPYGISVIEPVYDNPAVPGSGKAALKLITKDYSGSLVEGGVYTGTSNLWPMLKNLELGVPFTSRPLAMEGYVLYKPGTIDYAEEPYLDRAGKGDIAHVVVLLTDGDSPVKITPPDSYVNYTEDENIIGYGKMVFEEEMTEYMHFQLNIIYRNERTPSYVTVIASASALGDYLTGAAGSVLYVDDFAFLYGK